ncbi:MAG: hypothetical protein AMJ54_10915 [Deltaproteobacteria bacterium SG8_13]|nr:MAG: hypothetical protein AMJ54_10915 [Deltaproteobacteria bacterium SG8_13]
MKSSPIRFLFLTLGLVLLHIILSACSGPREIPESEIRTIGGTVEQDGVNSFRMKGDHFAVTYYTKIKGGEELRTALRVVFRKPLRGPDRFWLRRCRRHRSCQRYDALPGVTAAIRSDRSVLRNGGD